MFRNNRNKQKTNRNSSKFVKISTFFIPHTISSVCFSCFDTGPKQPNKAKQTEKKNFLLSRKSKPKNYQNRLSFGFFRFELRKNKKGYKDPLIENIFFEIFSVCFEKILFVSVVSIPVQHTETNQNKPKKMFSGFVKQTKKQPKQNEFWFVSVHTEKKFDCFEDTLSNTL